MIVSALDVVPRKPYTEASGFTTSSTFTTDSAAWNTATPASTPTAKPGRVTSSISRMQATSATAVSTYATLVKPSLADQAQHGIEVGSPA